MMTFQNMSRSPQLRVAVNSRCARACYYCRPSGEAAPTSAKAELQPDDLLFFVATAAELGMTEIKLTGGDPALYEPLVEVVSAIKSDTLIDKVEVISRHPQIGALAEKLANAGTDRFNVSLDTLSPDLHHRICGVNDLGELLNAISALVSTDVPVKINMVVMAGVNDDEIMDLIRFCESNGIESIKLLDVIGDLDHGKEFHFGRLHRYANAVTLKELYKPLADISTRIRDQAKSVDYHSQGDLGHPMPVFSLTSGLRVIVKDSDAGAWYGEICKGCQFFPCHDALMALRLTADLRLQYCLLRDDITVDIARIVKERDREQLSEILNRAYHEYDQAKFFAPTSAEPLSQFKKGIAS